MSCILNPIITDIIDEYMKDYSIAHKEWKSNVSEDDIKTLDDVMNLCLDNKNRVLFDKISKLSNKLSYYILEGCR